MSIDMYLSEVRSQTNSAVQLANAYSQAIGALADSCHAFMRAPLSGNTYDSAKLYFTTVYPPLVNGVTMVCDALTEAHQKFPNEFESSVDTCDVKESELSEKIAQGGQVLKAQYAAIDSLEKADPALERSIMRTQAAIAKLEETRKHLYEFNASSAGIFSEVESLLSQLNQGISEVGKGSAWNASTGTFELDRMSLSWIQPLNEKWNTRNQPKMDSERNEELKKYTLIKCYDAITDSVTWSIEHDGKRLDNAELQAYLKKIGEYLDESDYDILKLSPKEWETRINNQWKHGTEYFNGTDVPWFYQGLGHIQDFVGKRQADGTWDTMWSLGFTFSNIRNILKWNKKSNSITFNKPTKTITNKGVEVEFKNPKGKVIRWVEQNPKNIPKAIESAKLSKNSGKSVEGKVGEYVQGKTKITQFGQEILSNKQRITDLDIVTQSQIIEVKKSASAIKIDQIDRLVNPNNPQFFNYESKEVIVYIDQSIQGITNPNTLEKIQYLQGLESQNKLKIINSLNQLGEVLK